MKKILSSTLILAVLLSLCSCGLGEYGDQFKDIMSGLESLEEQLGSLTFDENIDMPENSENGDETPSPDGDVTTNGSSTPPVSGNYDFSGIGLTADQETKLTEIYVNNKPGVYTLLGDIYAYKCENGDVISFDKQNDHKLLSAVNGYKHYKLNYQNNGKNTYDMINYAENKKEFYTALLSYLNVFSLCKYEESKIYTSADEFLSELGITLLGPETIDVESPERYELLNYTEYSSKVDLKYIHTAYMHETHKFDYISEFSDKLLYWQVSYINSPEVYVESGVDLQFTEEFDHNDFARLRSVLGGCGMTNSNGSTEFAAINENGLNMFNGQLSIYTMPFKDEGETWNDTYKLTGYVNKAEGYPIPYILNVDFLYKYWYDGGSNATYVTRRDGLWRLVNDQSWLMISPDGTVHKYDYETGLPA